jgi:outer membrane receptor protein involved in Fe transport
MRIGFEAEDWEIYAFVDNLTDERAALFVQNTPPLGTVTINAPRTWGLGFSKSWGGSN